MPYFAECVGCGRVQSPASCPEGWVPVEAGAGWLDGDRALYYPTALLMRCVPCYRKAYPGDGEAHDPDDGRGGRRGAGPDHAGCSRSTIRSSLVLRDPVEGRVLALAARNATLKGTSTGGFSASDVSQLIVGQAGAAVTVARATNVPYQNSVTGSADTPGLVLVTFQDRI